MKANPQKKRKKRGSHWHQAVEEARRHSAIMGGPMNPRRRNPEAENRREIMMFAVMAGLVSALLPSVPTLVKYWSDDTEVTVFGRKMKYSTFLHWWVAASTIGLGVLWWKFRKAK